MTGNVLTAASNIICSHGGRVILTTSNTKVLVDGSPALIESDIHAVAGCPFMMGNKYSPCIQVEWSSGSSKTKIMDTPLLIKSSIGKCKSAEGVVQGIATTINTEIKVST